MPILPPAPGPSAAPKCTYPGTLRSRSCSPAHVGAFTCTEPYGSTPGRLFRCFRARSHSIRSTRVWVFHADRLKHDGPLIRRIEGKRRFQRAKSKWFSAVHQVDRASTRRLHNGNVCVTLSNARPKRIPRCRWPLSICGLVRRPGGDRRCQSHGRAESNRAGNSFGLQRRRSRSARVPDRLRSGLSRLFWARRRH
jgi:hypothetical protein